VGKTYPSEKYEFVIWDYDIPNIGKNKKCSKPPTSHQYHQYTPVFFRLFSMEAI